jgi:hypothetical protein
MINILTYFDQKLLFLIEDSSRDSIWIFAGEKQQFRGFCFACFEISAFVS